MENHIFLMILVTKMNMYKLLNRQEVTIWKKSLSNEFGRLVQGVGKLIPAVDKVSETNTLFFIHKSKIFQGAKFTYANFICDI